MALYESVIQYGEPKQRYQAYILYNKGTEGKWPGPWWGRVSDIYGFGIDGFITEQDAFDFLTRDFPEYDHAVQEIVWVAEPSKWRDSTGKTIYIGNGDM